MRQIADNHGADVFSDLRLFYLLSDYSSFDRLTDDSSIVKGLQNAGYGDLLVSASTSGEKAWKKDSALFISAFIRANSYDEAMVRYIADSMAYGLGLLSEPSAPNNSGDTGNGTSNRTWYKRFFSLCKRVANSIVKGCKKFVRWIKYTWNRIVNWFRNLPTFWKYFFYVIGALAVLAIIAIVLYYLFIVIIGLIVIGSMAKRR